MASKRKFHQHSIAGAPTLRSFLKTFNAYTISWFVLVSVVTGVYGYYFQKATMENGIIKWAATLTGEFMIFAIIIGLIILFIHDKRQTENPIQRLFPVLIWGRKLLVKVGPLLRQYLFLNDQEETPYNRITRNWVYDTSLGTRNTIGFGSQIDMDKVGTTLIMPATFTNTKSKTGEETGKSYKKIIGQHTGVEIGRAHV